MESYFDLGSHSRLITTASAEAQVWFNRGLNWLYGFNPTTLSRFDMTAGTPYAHPAYYAPYQEAVYVTSVSDDRRRVYDSHL
jgi:hypothetical protein